MKKQVFVFCVLAVFLSCDGGNKDINTQETVVNDVLAFPGAEGAGAFTTGGRGGLVYMVTNLDDDVAAIGSLRWALAQPGKKMIVFNVAGIIKLKRVLKIGSNVSILGQSAPGDGICIMGYPVLVEGDNVIIRFLRFRLGDVNGADEKAVGDALEIRGCKRVMIDHCSMSWSLDECVSAYDNEDFTMQYCIVSESLKASAHPKGNHGYGGIWGGKNVTFHHNLLAHHDSRNPRFDHDYVSVLRGPIDYVNNVVYNWGSNSTYGGESKASDRQRRTINMQNNYYKYGPNTRYKSRLLNPTISCGNCDPENPAAVLPGLFYLSGNYLYGYDDITADNWKGGVQGVSDMDISDLRSDIRFDIPAIEMQSAVDAYDKVLNIAGCSLNRDVVDERVINDVRNGMGGLIDSQADVGGWPEYQGALISQDSDQDGMPDDWETTHGLNAGLMLDASDFTLDEYYTNLEVYLNSLVEHLY